MTTQNCIKVEIIVSTHWKNHETDDVLGMIGDLQHTLWTYYHDQIHEIILRTSVTPKTCIRDREFEPDEYIPF